MLSPGSLSGKSLWWSWTAPFSGRASVTTAGTLFSNVLAVYRGPGLAGLSSVGQAWSSETDLASTVAFPALADVEYIFFVDGLSGAEGDVELSVTLHAGPLNHPFDKRLVLTGTNLLFVGDNREATPEPGEPFTAKRLDKNSAGDPPGQDQ